ncbi:MAG TPA: sulfatase [Bryobacteraceae bacterium]|nr:sulfatase [Bryobacteraceae bacterium]
MNRRAFLEVAASGVLGGAWYQARAQSQKPNVIFILADDLGYGDLGCYSSRIPTPNLDRMASEGIRFEQFCSTSSVCTPSRAGLLTGRYPNRIGLEGILFPDDDRGIPASETTIGQMLKGAGYQTMCVGKWHLGSRPEYLPTNRGFDEYFGIPYSNDMTPRLLMRNTEILEQNCRLDTLTQRYTEEAVGFIKRAKDRPFFLYFPHTFPHIPLAASSRFRKKSKVGLYGDSIMEMDWSVGEVLKTLAENNLDENTLIMFSSDNGPWYQGSPGELRGRKGDTWEGGMRVPFIARWKYRIPGGRVTSAFASTLDILPTVGRLAGAQLPAQPLDGVDIWPLLSNDEHVHRDVFLYFDGFDLQCARVDRWKLHVARYNSRSWSPEPVGGRLNLPLWQPELYDLVEDPEETADVSEDNPGIVKEILGHIERALPTFPGRVLAQWQDTMRRKVHYHPAGALPVENKTS